MKRDVKKTIMTTARDLFGARGYNDVSLRDIADVLGISVGNLTYHYKRKEDLIEAVIDEQHKSYRPAETARDIPALHAYFTHQFQFQSERQYYFHHYAQLADTCPRIFALQREMWGEMQVFLGQTLQALEDGGLLKRPLFAGQREGLVQAIMLICIHAEPYFERLGDCDSVRSGLVSLWSIIAPNLTVLGREQLREAFG